MTKDVLNINNIQIGKAFKTKEEAIRHTGDILVKGEYVQADYVNRMLEREKTASTYMGKQVAIPHGHEKDNTYVIQTGVSIVTIPSGIDFEDGNTVKLLIGIAGKGDEHLKVLSKIASICSDKEKVQKVINASSQEEIYNIFNTLNQ